jgi:hypothetical protein
MEGDLTRAGVVALFGMLVSLMPLGLAVTYMIRPTERWLALMRPLSLATIFAALNTLFSGLAATTRRLSVMQTESGFDIDRIGHGLSEALTPVFVACGFLTIAWLCIAVGMRRQG